MASCRLPLFVALIGLPVTGFGQQAVAVPRDPLEMVTGEVQSLDEPEAKQAAVQLLNKARAAESPRAGRQGYNLKVSFHVDSGGLTEYDGDWEMEEMFLAGRGTRWTAKAAAGFSATSISAGGIDFGEGAESGIPLRLEQARAALFGAIPTNLQRDLRSAKAMYKGREVDCFLIAGTEVVPSKAPGRRWDETEECIDPQSGLLQIHSQVPGWFYVYDYTDAPTIENRIMPRKVTITESGKTVVEIRVDSWTEMANTDPALFKPTPEMKWFPMTNAAQKLFLNGSKGSMPADAIIQPVCVFGLVNSDGKLVEAHSMQPTDPNSQAAVQLALRQSYNTPIAPTGAREQHLQFVIVKFVADGR